MSLLWISNARVIDPAAKRDGKGDVFMADGRFVARFTAAQKKQARKIDARGLVACPGLVDIHVHRGRIHHVGVHAEHDAGR